MVKKKTPTISDEGNPIMENKQIKSFHSIYQESYTRPWAQSIL